MWLKKKPESGTVKAESDRLIRRRFVAARRLVWVLLICGFIVSSLLASEGGMYLTIAAGGMPRHGPSLEREYVAGSSAQLLLVVRRPDGTAVSVDEYRGRHPVWPEGLTIAVATEDGERHPEWLSEMNIHPYIPWMETLADSLWRNKGQPVPDEVKSEHYDFIFNIPQGAAGHQITLSATFDHPKYGQLQTRTPAARARASEVLSIAATHSEQDIEVMRDAQIYYAKQSGDYERALALADSFMAQGYAGQTGLASALKAALYLERYDAAIRYMDANMEANGDFRIARHSDLPPLKTERLSKAEERQRNARMNQSEYERLRSEYLQKIAEQKK